MNLVFDSNKDSIETFGGSKKIDSYYLLRQNSKLKFNCNINFCNRIKLVVLARTVSGGGKVSIKVGEIEKQIDVCSKNTKEFPIIFEINDFIYSKEISISYKNRRGRVIIDRVTAYSEFIQAHESNKKQAFHLLTE